MSFVAVYVRRSDINERLEKIGELTRENNLIYSDEGRGFAAHLSTTLKFTAITAMSPLIGLARLVRSATFLIRSGDVRRARSEFIGALSQQLIASYCLTGTLLSFSAYVISAGEISFYVSLRRTYAYFEAWVNGIDLKNPALTSYSRRVSTPGDFCNEVWTTAPCMQPVLERGYAKIGGLQDAERMKRIFPFMIIDGVRTEYGELVIQSHYVDQDIHYTMCDDAYEHSSKEATCCCCYRVEAVYDRFLCAEVGEGRCTSMINAGDSCGIVACNTCGIGACCCYLQENNEVTLVNAGCFGPHGPSCLIGMER